MLTALQEIRKPISSRREEDESLHVEINGAAKDETSTGTLRIETLLTPGSALFGVRLHQLGSLALACLFCRPSGLVLSLSSVSQRAQIIIQHQPRHRQQDKQKRPPITTQGYTTRLLAASHAVYSTAIITTPCPCRVSRRLFSLSLSTHSPNYSSTTTTTTTTTTTARRCLCHLVHASFDVANGLSYFRHQLHAAFIHSFILTHHPRAGHLTHHFHHNTSTLPTLA
jgi:hypothetical protein